MDNTIATTEIKENTVIPVKKVRGVPFKKGKDERRNLEGKPLGTKNFDTLFEAAIKKIAQEKKLPISDPEREMVIRAVVEALKGNFAYYRDIMDRRYGQPVKPIEHSGEITENRNIELDKDTLRFLKEFIQKRKDKI